MVHSQGTGCSPADRCDPEEEHHAVGDCGRRTAGGAGSLDYLSLAPIVPGQEGPVGPRDTATGYPSWYKDANGVKVDYCLTYADCVGGNSLPDPGAPASAATGNLPDEAFYEFAEAET